MKIGSRVAAIVLIGIFAAGCAAPGYDSGALERSLVSAGVSPKAAKCVINAMNDKFGQNRLGARVTPSADEAAAQRTLLRKCQVKVGK